MLTAMLCCTIRDTRPSVHVDAAFGFKLYLVFGTILADILVDAFTDPLRNSDPIVHVLTFRCAIAAIQANRVLLSANSLSLCLPRCQGGQLKPVSRLPALVLTSSVPSV